jgi:undecaprenyl-diphosphatase
MNFIQSIILGVVEGLTEFLPISSTFHLIVTSRLLSLPSSDFVKLFEVVIQSGAIFALVFLYLKTLLQDKKLLMNVIYSFIPTGLIAFLLHHVIKTVFFENNLLMLTMFVLVGIIFLTLERYLRNSQSHLSKTCVSMSPKQAILIGFAQACAIVPGVSRSGSIIVAMMIMGYKRDESAKYTFLLSLPTIFAASALDLFQNRALLTGMSDGWLLIAVGFVTSLVVAYVVVKWFIHYLSTHTLAIFGWYRLVATALLVLFRVLP